MALSKIERRKQEWKKELTLLKKKIVGATAKALKISAFLNKAGVRERDVVAAWADVADANSKFEESLAYYRLFVYNN